MGIEAKNDCLTSVIGSMVLMISPLLFPTSEMERIRSSMLASFGSSVSACCSRRSRISFSWRNWARLFAIDCFWMRSSSSRRCSACRCWMTSSVGPTARNQLAVVIPSTTTPTATSFCGSGTLLTRVSSSCVVSAMGTPSSGVGRDAGDLPIDHPVRALVGALDGDVAEVLGGFQLFGEAREVLVGDGVSLDGDCAGLLDVLADPDLGGNDGGQLVEHLDWAGTALLEGVEDLELVLERLLLLGDRLHFADGLLELNDLRLGVGDLAFDVLHVLLGLLVPDERADHREDREQTEQDELLSPVLALLRRAHRQQVDPDHRSSSLAAMLRSFMRSSAPPCAGARGRRRRRRRQRSPSRSWGRTPGCRSRF